MSLGKITIIDRTSSQHYWVLFDKPMEKEIANCKIGKISAQKIKDINIEYHILHYPLWNIELSGGFSINMGCCCYSLFLIQS